MKPGRWTPALCAAVSVVFVACEGGDIDAGRNVRHGMLPVDERNPVILSNDSGTDNWTGEYAMLLANSGGPPLVGIIVNPSSYWPDLDANVKNWNQLITAARGSGLRNIPDATPSPGEPLSRPADGLIESTTPNRSEGAKLIIDLAARFALPWRPVVVVTGSRLTEIADAYLMDPTVAQRVVVVSSLGGAATNGSSMGWPNGELDPWADWIVAKKFTYVQVNGYYEQRGDVTTTTAKNLPANLFGNWMSTKAANVLQIAMASDQIGVLAVGVPTFATVVGRAVVDATADMTQPPVLLPADDGPAWVVSSCDGAMAGARLWKMLQDPRTFGP